MVRSSALLPWLSAHWSRLETAAAPGAPLPALALAARAAAVAVDSTAPAPPPVLGGIPLDVAGRMGELTLLACDGMRVPSRLADLLTGEPEEVEAGGEGEGEGT
jgi:hypothetical protein